MAGFEVEKLNFSYTKQGSRTISDLSFSLEESTFTAILGPNGAGKTSLLKLMLGLVRPDSGQVRFQGKDLANWTERDRARQIAYLPQNSQARLQMAVREVILMGRYPWRNRWSGLSRADREAFTRAVELTGLAALVDRPYSQLSGGERQRVLLARAVCQDSKWLLLDEASANLDLAYQIEIFELLKKLQLESGISILAVLHDLNLAARYADQSILLQAGRMVQGPDSADPFNSEKLSQLYKLDLTWLDDGQGNRYLAWH